MSSPFPSLELGLEVECCCRLSGRRAGRIWCCRPRADCLPSSLPSQLHLCLSFASQNSGEASYHKREQGALRDQRERCDVAPGSPVLCQAVLHVSGRRETLYPSTHAPGRKDGFIFVILCRMRHQGRNGAGEPQVCCCCCGFCNHSGTVELGHGLNCPLGLDLMDSACGEGLRCRDPCCPSLQCEGQSFCADRESSGLLRVLNAGLRLWPQLCQKRRTLKIYPQDWLL